MAGDGKKFDVALSFAGEDRQHAEALARALKALEVRVFYDGFEKSELWGRNLYDYLADLYQSQASYCVMFLSKYYAAKAWTSHERQAAQARAFREKGEYILPLRMDDTVIPGLAETVGYLDWRNESVSSVANMVLDKLGKRKSHDRLRFNYKFEPEPGPRYWHRIGDVQWVEQYPSGHSSTFVVVNRGEFNGDTGYIVRKVIGDADKTLVPDYRMEVFIPDPGSKRMWLALRHLYPDGWTAWRYFVDFEYID